MGFDEDEGRTISLPQTAVEEDRLAALPHRDPQILGSSLTEALDTENISFGLQGLEVLH